MSIEEHTSPEERAEVAARDLADRGLAVTARAVRESAGVRMAVAAAVAKAWRDSEAENAKLTIPDVPPDVTARFTAIWSEAYRAAFAVVSPERDRLATEVAELRKEVESLTTELAEVEDERDAAHSAASEAEARTAKAERDAQEQETLTQIAQVTAREAEAERDRLIEQINSLITRIPTPEQ